MLRSRCLLIKWGGIPLAMPPVLGGLLRLMVRVTWGSQWELIQGWLLCFPSRWQRRAALESSSFSRMLKAGWLVPGGRRPIIGSHLRFHSPQKCMRKWLALEGHLFLPQTELVLLPSSLCEYVEIPPVEHAITVQLCPWGAAAWQGNPRLLSRARGFLSVSMAKAYRAAGQAASALQALALLQIYQAKALKQLYEGSSDPCLIQELRTDRQVRVDLGQTRFTLVVQERQLWLDLADKSESISHAVECFA